MNIQGKTVVVTGATSGLGQAFAIEAAAKGARVVVVGRDAMRAKETMDAIERAGGQGELILGDVSTRAGVKALAQNILGKFPRIDVLVNNAGGTFAQQSNTQDGIETTFALNTLGAFILEHELHSALAASRGRIVNLATGFLNSFPVQVDDLAAPKKYSAFGQYGRSKQASVMMTVEQAARYASEGITAVALHPGIIMGTRFAGGPPKPLQAIMGPIMRAVGFAVTLEESTRRFMVAAFDTLPSGSYLVNGKVAQLPKQTQDAQVREQVYGLLAKLATP